MPTVTIPVFPHIDKYAAERVSRELTDGLGVLGQTVHQLATETSHAFIEMHDRIHAAEEAMVRLQLLLSAIQKDLPAIIKDCPNVLAVAANIAIEEGGLG